MNEDNEIYCQIWLKLGGIVMISAFLCVTIPEATFTGKFGMGLIYDVSPMLVPGLGHGSNSVMGKTLGCHT